MIRVHSLLTAEQDEIVAEAMDGGFTVHRALGPGFREIIYERAYCLELDSRRMRFECEKPIEVKFKDWKIPGQKVDLVVEGIVLIEIKVVPRLRPIHRAQVQSYLKTMGLRVGLLMNFNVTAFKDGFQRVVY